MSQEIQMPFVPVTKSDTVWGNIPNMEEAIVACPKEYFNNSSFRGFSRLANDLFAHYAGWSSMSEAEIAEVREATNPDTYTDEKFQYVLAWLKSFAPKHEHKIAVVSWCLAHMLTKPPPYTMN